MPENPLIYPAAGLVTALASIVALKALDRLADRLPKWIVAAARRRPLATGSECRPEAAPPADACGR